MLEKKVLQFIELNNLITSNTTIIVGLSGGPDSICLLNILKKLETPLEINIIAAHLDHGLRTISIVVVIFCKNACDNLNIKFISKTASEITLKKKPSSSSKEELGRLLRRTFFEELATEHNADYIALGHNYNDQIETFFIRLIRGATIAGLACMYPKRNKYIRPLLETQKSDILDCLDKNRIDYLKDSTNELDIFLRNKIRNHLIPKIQEVDPRFTQTFVKTLTSIQETDLFISRIVDNTITTLLTPNGLNKYKFEQTDSFLHIPILIKWFCIEEVQFIPTKSFFKEILRFIAQPGSAIHQIAPTWSISKKNNFLKIIKL